MPELGDSNDVDFRQTDTSNLEERPFPVNIPSDYRVHFGQEAYEEMKAHAASSTTVELGGVLVGDRHYDGQGPYLEITAIIPAEGAENHDTQMTFTHETWDHINRTMDERFSNHTILGWYHTHPGFGIFLSEMDRFIQQNFFNEPFQIAVVIDPKGELEGCFAWEQGELRPQSRYWCGSKEVQLNTDADPIASFDRVEHGDSRPEKQGLRRNVGLRDTITTLLLLAALLLLWFYTYRTHVASTDFGGYLAMRLENAQELQRLETENLENRLESLEANVGNRFNELERDRARSQTRIATRIEESQTAVTRRIDAVQQNQESDSADLAKRVGELDNVWSAALAELEDAQLSAHNATDKRFHMLEANLLRETRNLLAQQRANRAEIDGEMKELTSSLDRLAGVVAQLHDANRNSTAQMLYDALDRELSRTASRSSDGEDASQSALYSASEVEDLIWRFRRLRELEPSLVERLRTRHPNVPAAIAVELNRESPDGQLGEAHRSP